MEINRDILQFYTDFFGNHSKAEKLIRECYSFSERYTFYNEENLVELAPRRVVNNIARIMTYSDKLSPASSHNVHVFFWITCIESICFIPTEARSDKKARTIRQFFKENLSISDRNFLTQNIKPVIEPRNYFVSEVADIFNDIRNSFVHEGNVYFNFPTEKEFRIQITSGSTFQVRATYEQVRSIFIRTYLKYLGRLLEAAKRERR